MRGSCILSYMNNEPRPVAILGRTAAERILREHYPTILAIFKAAWDAWTEFQSALPETHKAMSSSARARFIYDVVVDRAKAAFGGNQDVAVSEARGFLLLRFGDRILLRFKKLDRNKRSRNIQTQQQILFTYQLQLPGFGDQSTKVIAGYQLDEAQTKIQHVLLTCPEGASIAWWAEIGGLADDSGQVSATPVAPSTPPVVRAIGVKRVDKR